MRSLSLMAILSLLAACKGDKGTGDDGTTDSGGLDTTDNDGDGYNDDVDCDDDDASVNPGASEVCDDIDNNCDGQVDEGLTNTWYADDDGDGYGFAGSPETACEQPTGYVADPTDCDDSDSDVHPDAADVCDGIDNDCDGQVDEGGVFTWYADEDDDGYGNESDSIEDCAEPSGYVLEGGDCDDSDSAVNPAAEEVCDGIDNNCDGTADEGGDVTWYMDADSDGYGDPSSTLDACEQPSGYVLDATDCDDTTADVNPGAAELCDGIDNDCNGDVDDGATMDTWYIDADGDGYGDAASSTESCEQPSGYVADATDCDDAESAVNPAASEVCDGIDNDCDSLVDDDDSSLDSTTGTWYYADTDGDGYGDGYAKTQACTQPSGYVTSWKDCDDADSAINPAASEVCDGVDNDCDSLVDDDDTSLDTTTATWYYEDSDGDGYGNGHVKTRVCAAPSGYVTNWRDCDDADSAVKPGAQEICDGIDNDCDSLVDDADSSLDTSTASTWWADADGDGFGDASTSDVACDEPSGYTGNDEDCDDSDGAINPDATEECNGYDDDCDGVADSTDVCPCDVEYYDTEDHPYLFCETLSTWADAQADCDTYGYHLLAIDDVDEDTWATDTAVTFSTAKWWMGFNDITTEGTWEWESGSTSTYTNWQYGEPNNTGRGEDCGQLNRFYPDYTWNDEPCSYTFRYICEAD